MGRRREGLPFSYVGLYFAVPTLAPLPPEPCPFDPTPGVVVRVLALASVALLAAVAVFTTAVACTCAILAGGRLLPPHD